MEPRWKAIAEKLPAEVLRQDYAGADRLGRLAVGRQCVYYTRLLGGVDYLPFSAVARAYRREEDCSSMMGCCRQSFVTHYLVLVLPDGRLKKLEADRKEEVKQALELLEERGPGIASGFVGEEK